MAQAKKHSKKRDAILECLRSTTCHPSAEWVFTQLKPQIPDLSLATVYRNLALFLEDGTISSVGVVSGLERFDAATEPHVHFICTGCGKILDLHQLAVPVDLEAQVSQVTGGCVNCSVLSFHGRCRECLETPTTGLSGKPA
ncbi:MAG: transcriptional repressor [Ruminococcaceae bacterium]|nr:transcriptional repressor [Oscillospiraceae bacterium]